MSCRPWCDTRGLLHAALLDLVGERPLSEALLPALCARAGVTRADFDEQYPSVVACLADAYEAISHRVIGDYTDAFAQGESWPSGLQLGTERMLTGMAERPAEAWLWFVDAYRSGRELLRRSDATRRRMVRLFADAHRLHERGEQPSSIQHEMLIGAGFRMIAERVAAGRVDELPALAPDLAELVELFGPVAA